MRASVVGTIVGLGVSITAPHAAIASTGGDDGPVPTTCFSTSLITSQLSDPSQICLPADFNERIDETVRRNRSRSSDIGWWRLAIKPAIFIVIAVVVQASRLFRRRRSSQPDFRSFTPQARPAPPPPPPFGQSPLGQPPFAPPSPPPPPPPADRRPDG